MSAVETRTFRERVSIAFSGHVADVRLVRAEKMNALDDAMFSALGEAIDALKAWPGLRAVVLSGEGPAFCAGLDMGRMKDLVASGHGSGADLDDFFARTHGPANLPQYVAVGWRLLPVPVIAALSGVAFGGGLQVAMGADVRLAAPDTRLSIMEIRWGLVPDMGGMGLMRDLVRGDHLRELIYTGRIVEAPEAQALGLVSRICADPRGEALALARDIASRSPSAIRAAKRLLELDGQSADPARLAAEASEQAALKGGDNQREAGLANLEKRSPVFRD